MSPLDKVEKIAIELTGVRITKSNNESFIPFTDIEEICLNREKKKLGKNHYSCTIQIKTRQPIHILDYDFNEQGDQISQTTAYRSFIQELHFHLHGKGSAIFKSGVNSRLYPFRVMAVLAFLAAFPVLNFYLDLSDYLLIPPLLLTILVAIVGFKFWAVHTSQNYSPVDIPSYLLPGKSPSR